MDDYSDFIPAPELFDLNRDGILDSDELLYFFLCEEYANEEFSKSSNRIRCGDLLLFGGLLLLLNLFFDAIFGGSSRVGRRMRSGGYRSRSRSSGGGGFLAWLIVGGLCLLMSHPRANSRSCRRSMFRKQPVPACYRATRQTMKQERKSKPASPKNSSSTGSVPKATKSSQKGNPSSIPKAAQRSKNGTNPERRPAEVSGSVAWRDACEDGSPYGLDPRNYATEEQYIDALNTAKFAAQFHKKKQE